MSRWDSRVSASAQEQHTQTRLGGAAMVMYHSIQDYTCGVKEANASRDHPLKGSGVPVDGLREKHWKAST